MHLLLIISSFRIEFLGSFSQVWAVTYLVLCGANCAIRAGIHISVNKHWSKQQELFDHFLVQHVRSFFDPSNDDDDHDQDL